MTLRLLLLFAGFSTCITSSSQPGPDSTTVLDYLRNNHQQLDIGSANAPFLFDSTFYRNRVFLFGETHGSAEPHQADVYFFRSLYRTAGVRTYIAEVDVTKAWMLNNYLADGNENWLKKVFASWVADTSQWASKENLQKYRELRKFYQSLPANAKFSIIGVDLAQDYTLIREYLQEILAQSKSIKTNIYLDSLKAMIDTISWQGRGQLGAFSRRFLEQIATNTRLAGTTGKNHRQFLRLLRSLSFVEPGISRDSIMYRNFEDYITINEPGEGKFYGFLGLFHCLTTGYNDQMPFAALLDKVSESFRGKVTSVIMYAAGGKSMLPLVSQLRSMMPSFVIDKITRENPEYKDGRYIPYDLGNDQSMMMVKGIEYLKRSSTAGSITLFRLTSKGSPYSESRLSGEVSGVQQLKMTEPSDVTTDAMQYILLFRNARASTPVPL